MTVKLLRPGYATDRDFRERFRREFDAVRRVQHPHVVPVYEFAADAGRAWFTMRRLADRHLGEAFAGGCRPAEAARLLVPVADALATAFERAGVSHRDLKPSDVVFDADGRPVVVDFGLAVTARDGPAGLRAEVVGRSGPYTAPEFRRPDGRRGNPVRADVYSLGAVLYAGLTTIPPPEAFKPAELWFPGEVPEDLRAVCRKCLDPDPGRRYERMADVRDELQAVLDGRPVAARRGQRGVARGGWARDATAQRAPPTRRGKRPTPGDRPRRPAAPPGRPTTGGEVGPTDRAVAGRGRVLPSAVRRQPAPGGLA